MIREAIIWLRLAYNLRPFYIYMGHESRKKHISKSNSNHQTKKIASLESLLDNQINKRKMVAIILLRPRDHQTLTNRVSHHQIQSNFMSLNNNTNN